MAQLNIRIDDDLKEQGDKLFSTLGLSFSTAFSIFVSQSVREGGLPFSVTTKTECDPFYSESNMKALQHSIQQGKEGKFIRKTLEELQAMEK